MLQYLSNNDTLLSEDGIKTLNAYALKGYPMQISSILKI